MHPATTSTPAAAPDRRLQQRTLGILSISQMIGGTGLAMGIAVGAPLAARIGGTAVSGLAQSAAVIGTALIAVPASRLMNVRGRRPGLGAAYLVGALGAVLVLLAAAGRSLPLLFAGLFLFGGGNTANLQSRYAAVDLAEPARRGRQLSFVIWATTIGSVAGPSLAPLCDDLVRRFGTVQYSGPFLATAVAYALAAVLVLVALRPDPLLTARARAAAAGSDRTDAPSRGMRAAARELRGSPPARLGVAAMLVGHAVMISIMAMTPVHIDSAGHPDALRIVGLVLSVHIAGMYALAPVTGWLADRLGRRPVILGGIALLLAACAVAGLAGHDTRRLTVGLGLLGLGWSGMMIAGSTLVTDSVGLGNRASVQALADGVTGVGGAMAAAVAGLVMAWSSYAVLTAFAALVTVPLLAAVLRPAPRATVHAGAPLPP